MFVDFHNPAADVDFCNAVYPSSADISPSLIFWATTSESKTMLKGETEA